MGANGGWRLGLGAALATLAMCLLFFFLPSFSQAGGVVTNCSNQVDLQAKLAGGGLVTFNCGVATVPITATLAITQPTTIDGGGVITLDGQGVRRILEVTGGVALTLTNLTLDRGRPTTGNGGAVRSDGPLTLVGVTVTRSSASHSLSSGGGVWTSSSVVVTASRFVSNTAPLQGGGLWSDSATVSGSSFVSNTAGDSGGGLYTSVTATVTGSSFVSNTAGIDGGGLRAISATVSGSSFLTNSAARHGGALWATGAVSLENATLHANSALSGSVLYNSSSTDSTLAFLTLSANSAPSGTLYSAGPLTLSNSIAAQPSGVVCAGPGSKTLVGINFLPDSSCGLAYTPADPLLGPLAENGGPTLTRALLAGSPAIDTANGCPASGVDQRGALRAAPCDVGAYEFGAKPTLTGLVPSSVLQGSGAFTLQVEGSNFLSGTVALWGGSVRPTTVVSATRLLVAVGASDVAMAGVVTVTARYGEAADSVSNSLPFTVTAPTPTPTATPTPTETPTPSPTPTGTSTPSPTPTATSTPSPTPTATSTPSPTPTATSTPSPTPTATSTPTPTSTPSGSGTPGGGSGTPTPTETPGVGPAATPSPTSTPSLAPSGGWNMWAPVTFVNKPVPEGWW
jgi:predicted outer membrane repeat protein